MTLILLPRDATIPSRFQSPGHGNHDPRASSTTRCLEIYPDRVNPGSLWSAANNAKKQP